MGYYINPNATPISKIDFSALKRAGITDIYVLVNNDNYFSVLTDAKKQADAVGIRTNAWVFPGFKHAPQVAGMKIGVQLDVETYNMASYVPQVLAMRLATRGVPFSVTVKPDIWDGKQYLYLIVPLCDYVVPQLYMGDYNRGIKGLTNWVKIYNIIYPGKIVAGLQTYESYKNTSLKSSDTILKEVQAVKPYTRGVILFRYGLSNYKGD